MSQLDLYRYKGSITETLGHTTLGTLLVLSLERPWLNNAPDISCIPAGTYVCKYNQSAHLSALAGSPVFTYELQNVPNRSGIRIHSANRVKELLGCISLGMGLGELGFDVDIDLINSKEAIDALYRLFNGEDFNLIIHDIRNVGTNS